MDRRCRSLLGGLLSSTCGVLAVVTLGVLPANAAQDLDGLRIVVLEGEDSVNIIAQGTAVPTLVEVRDRNDLPVEGASVVFLLGEGGTATLNAGLSQVAVTTNALGQAAVTVNPVASGAVQLQVSAVFQGQTATATIVQTNFATAAQAAAAGVGGGTSTGAVLGITGAAVGGAAVVIGLRVDRPVIYEFTPTPSTVKPNDAVTLHWRITGAVDRLVVSGGELGGRGKEIAARNTTLTVRPTENSTYTLTVRNKGGSASRTARVEVMPPPVITGFTPRSITVERGGSVTLRWEVKDGGSVTRQTVTGGELGDSGREVAPGTTMLTVRPTETTTYTLTVENAVGRDTARVKVTVTVMAKPEITSFTPRSITVERGGSVTLRWEVKDGGSVTRQTVTGGELGDSGREVAPGTTMLTVRPTETTTYTLTVENAVGRDTARVKVTVTVMAKPEITSFTPRSITVERGGSVTLRWEVKDGGSVTRQTVTGGELGDSGREVAPGTTMLTVRPTETTTYTLTVENAVGRDTARVKVTVTVMAKPEITSFTPRSITVERGGSVTLRWEVKDGGSVTRQTVTGGELGDSGREVAPGTTMLTVRPTETSTYRLTVANAVGSATDSVTVKVEEVTESTENTCPEANDDEGPYVEWGQSVTIQASTLLANDIDADGDTLRITSVSDPEHGRVSLSDTTVTFVHDAESSIAGDYAFFYSVSDGKGCTDSARVAGITGFAPLRITSFTIDGGASATIRQDEEVTLRWTLSGDAAEVAIVSITHHGETLELSDGNELHPATMEYKFTPTDDGKIVLDVANPDELSDTDTATVTVSFAPEPEPLSIDSFTVNGGASATIDQGEEVTLRWTLSGSAKEKAVFRLHECLGGPGPSECERITSIEADTTEYEFSPDRPGHRTIELRAENPDNPDDLDSATVEVTVNAPLLKITSFTVNGGASATIAPEEEVTLRWTLSGSAKEKAVFHLRECWGPGPSECERITSIEADTTEYEFSPDRPGHRTIWLRAENPGNSVDRDDAYVEVTWNEPRFEITSFTVNGDDVATIAEGEEVTLRWTLSGSASQQIVDGESGAIAQEVVPGATMLAMRPAETSSYTLTVANKAGDTVSKSVGVRVEQQAGLAPPTVSDVLPPLTLVAGGEVAVVDLTPAFIGAAAYAATSSDSAMAAVSVADATLTVTPGGREGAATVTVTASNRAGAADQTFTVQVAPDPVDSAVVNATLAAFGRNVLASATDTLGRRFESMSQSSTLTVAGRRIPLAESDSAEAAEGGIALDAAAEQFALASGWLGRPGVWSPPVGDVAASEAAMLARSGMAGARDLTAMDLLGRSEFALGLGGGAAGQEPAGGAGDRRLWTVWGAGDLRSFNGGPEGASYTGRPTLAYVGLDTERGRLLAGVAVSRAMADMSYSFQNLRSGKGEMSAGLTSVQPYLRYAVDARTDVWGIFGAGSGSLDLTRSHAEGKETSDLGLLLGAAGVRRELGSVGAADLALRGDVGLVRLSTDGASGVMLANRLTNVQRYRVGVEVSTTQAVGGGQVKPFVELGGLYDGGSGQTGAGMEVAGGVQFLHAGSGFGLEARARMLALHAASGYRERGVLLTASLTPGGRDGRGLSLSVAPGYGAPAQGGGIMWRDQVFGGAPAGLLSNHSATIDSRVGYGLPLGQSSSLLTPYSEYGFAEAQRRLRFGVRLGAPDNAPRGLQFDFAGEQSDYNGRRDYRLGALGRIRF